MSPSRNRAISVSITDFSPAEQRLLRAAFHAFVPFDLIGGLEEGAARVIALGILMGLQPIVPIRPASALRDDPHQGR